MRWRLAILRFSLISRYRYMRRSCPARYEPLCIYSIYLMKTRMDIGEVTLLFRGRSDQTDVQSSLRRLARLELTKPSSCFGFFQCLKMLSHPSLPGFDRPLKLAVKRITNNVFIILISCQIVKNNTLDSRSDK